MAEVFRARLDAPGGAAKILVVKRIRAGASEDPSFLRHFVDEARIALPLSHDNVTSVFEFGEVDGQYFLAMEHVHGQNYAQVLRRAAEVRGHLPRELALFVAAEVAKGLAYAHGFQGPDGEHRGVVHLDVSPQNVLVSYDGAVKLTDFGISRAVGWQGGREGAPLLGKASYLAPEQLRGDPVDARTDLYALGCVLYESLVGEPPHGRGSDEQVLGRLREGNVKPPSAIDPSLAAFDDVTMRALAPRPEDRHPGAAEMHKELSRLLHALGPGTDAPQLAAWMREAFVDELRPAARADHVARQLAAAGFDDRDQHTVRMQDVATVALPGPAEAPAVERRGRWRKRALVSAGAAAALAIGGGAAFALLPGSSPATAASEVRRETALVSLHSWPSAQVELDGTLLAGRTPIADLEVAAGDHQLVFTHEELDLRREIDVHLEPGSSRTVVVTLR